MELILWRHAQAEDTEPDAERALTDRGRKDAVLVGGWLCKRLPEHGATVLSSPTRRTRETADLLHERYRVAGRIEVLDALGPHATAADALRVAGWSEPRDGCVILVGHQPWIGAAAALALTGEARPWPMRKAGFWWLQHRGGDVRVRAAMSPELLR